MYLQYLSTLASSTLIILFSEMLKLSKNISFKSENIVKENNEYLEILDLLKMDVSKLIIYLFNGHVLKWARYYGMSKTSITWPPKRVWESSIYI